MAILLMVGDLGAIQGLSKCRGQNENLIKDFAGRLPDAQVENACVTFKSIGSDLRIQQF